MVSRLKQRTVLSKKWKFEQAGYAWLCGRSRDGRTIQVSSLTLPTSLSFVRSFFPQTPPEIDLDQCSTRAPHLRQQEMEWQTTVYSIGDRVEVRRKVELFDTAVIKEKPSGTVGVVYEIAGSEGSICKIT